MEKANLRGVNLAEADLTSATLTGASIERANLLDAKSLVGTTISDAVGLSASARDAALARGAHWAPLPPIAPAPDTRRFRDHGKYRGLVQDGVRRQRGEYINALEDRLGPGLEDIIQALAAALDYESFIDREGLDKRYMADFRDIAKGLIAWMAGAGYQFTRPVESEGVHPNSE
jgi:hypothetical protein